MSARPARVTVERSSRRRVSRVHRARLLEAAVLVADELGYSRTTVTQIVAQSEVSRSTFYALFADRDECLVAVVKNLSEAIQEELDALGLETLCWRERVRTGLAEILRFLDLEPALARVCIVEAARGGPCLIAAQEGIIERLVAVVEQGRLEPGCLTQATPLTAEVLVGAVFRVVHSRLASRRGPLLGLLCELTSMIVLPYLGHAAASDERQRPIPSSAPRARPEVSHAPPAEAGTSLDAPKIRMTYRTTRVLESIGEHPGATNSAIARLAGITDQGQVSKLLARLSDRGLIANGGDLRYKWSVNTWSLTPSGEAFIQGVRRRRPSPASLTELAVAGATLSTATSPLTS